MKLLSVIVPVYNTEKYVEQCVYSILNQPESDNIEVVLVDDGSTDSSGKICDDLAKNDFRIHVIHKTNGGVSSARNAGIEIAEGEYLMFLDSDDFWSDNKLPELIRHIQISMKDLYLVSVQSYRNGNTEALFFDASTYSDISITDNGQEALKSILNKNYRCGWCLHWLVIKRDIVIKNSLRFPTGALCEDVFFIFRLWFYIKTSEALPVILYNYRRDNQSSITHLASIKFSSDLLEMCIQNLEFAKQHISDNEFMDLVKLNLQTLVEVVIIHYSNYARGEREHLDYLLSQLKEIYSLHNNRTAKIKEQLVGALIKVLGYTAVSKIWNMKLLLNH